MDADFWKETNMEWEDDRSPTTCPEGASARTDGDRNGC
jgi:hypothetical protein